MLNLRLDRLRAFLIALSIWVGIYVPALGTPEFKGEEGRRVLPAVTMLETGNWTVPYVGGEPYYNKPPFINWLVAISFILTGERTELSARLPSALFVLGFVALLIFMRSPWQSLSGRLIGAIVFMTNISLVEKGRLIEIEAVYICLTAMAILWWLNVWSDNGSAWSLWVIPSVILGCGMLTKGPVIVLLFYVTVISVLVYSRRIKALISLEHLVGILVLFGISYGWTYLASRHISGTEMMGQMSQQMFSRILPTNIDFAKWGKNILKSFCNFLPWLLAVPAMWNEKYTSNIRQEHRALFKGCRLSMVLGFALIVLMPKASSRYSMPVLGLASILLGWVLSLVKELPAGGRLWRNLLLAGLILSCLSAIAGFFAVEIGIYAFVICIMTVCMTILIFEERHLFRTPLGLSILTAGLTVIFMLQYAVFGMSMITKHEARRPVAASINSIVPREETLYVLKPGYQAFLFYVRPPLEYVISPRHIDADVRYLLLKEDALEELLRHQNVSSRSPRTLYSFTSD